MSTIVKNIHIFKNNKWTPIKRVYDGNTWKKMKGLFFEGVWYEIGVTCVVMPDGCAVSTSTHPRWDESATSYGTNNFGFNIFPGGVTGWEVGGTVYFSGNFYSIGKNGYWWASSENSTSVGKSVSIFYASAQVVLQNNYKNYGFSVRCVKDYTGSHPNGTIISDDYTDGEGNTYDVVVIGEQLWTIKNLYSTKYQNEVNIPNVTVSTDLTTGAYCWYNNDYTTYGQYYGALYNWYAVDNGLVDNNGYRVPSNADWFKLTDYLIDTNWCNDVTVTTSNTAQFLKSCRQVNHPLA